MGEKLVKGDDEFLPEAQPIQEPAELGLADRSTGHSDQDTVEGIPGKHSHTL